MAGGPETPQARYCLRAVPSDGNTGSGGLGRVLIVEDDPAVAEVLAYAIERGGAVEVSVAVDGIEGIQAARSWEPDLILCDVMLPGMSGLELARALQDSPPPSPPMIVFITGTANVAFRDRTPADYGAIGAIRKPLDVMRLPDMLRKLMQQHGQATRAADGSA